MQDIHLHHYHYHQMEQVPEVELNSGHKIPVIGMGTGSTTLPPLPDLISIFLQAIDAGYRHFDTAAIYGSEEALGRAVAEALDRGLIKSREDLFITSKLWCTEAAPELVLPALRNTLEKLGLEYVDLYLIHWPARLKKGVKGPDTTSKDVVLPLDTKRTWEAMEECSRLGLAKSIGVSNFTSTKITNLLQHATIPPAVNQVEMNPTWQQKKLIEFCKDKGIKVAAYSPLGANGAPWGTLAVMQNSTLADIAAAKGKTLAQVAIRWIYEQGAIVIVKSFNKERMKLNLQLFDWSLTKEELALIDKIPQQRSCTGYNFVGPDGPFKSLDELWDGET